MCDAYSAGRLTKGLMINLRVVLTFANPAKISFKCGYKKKEQRNYSLPTIERLDIEYDLKVLERVGVELEILQLR